MSCYAGKRWTLEFMHQKDALIWQKDSSETLQDLHELVPSDRAVLTLTS